MLKFFVIGGHTPVIGMKYVDASLLRVLRVKFR